MSSRRNVLVTVAKKDGRSGLIRQLAGQHSNQQSFFYKNFNLVLRPINASPKVPATIPFLRSHFFKRLCRFRLPGSTKHLLEARSRSSDTSARVNLFFPGSNDNSVILWLRENRRGRLLSFGMVEGGCSHRALDGVACLQRAFTAPSYMSQVL
jgi:hypothetical protein